MVLRKLLMAVPYPNLSKLMSLPGLSALCNLRLQWCENSNTSWLHLVIGMNSSKAYPLLQYQSTTCFTPRVRKIVSQTKNKTSCPIFLHGSVTYSMNYAFLSSFSVARFQEPTVSLCYSPKIAKLSSLKSHFVVWPENHRADFSSQKTD